MARCGQMDSEALRPCRRKWRWASSDRIAHGVRRNMAVRYGPNGFRWWAQPLRSAVTRYPFRNSTVHVNWGSFSRLIEQSILHLSRYPTTPRLVLKITQRIALELRRDLYIETQSVAWLSVGCGFDCDVMISSTRIRRDVKRDANQCPVHFVR